MQVTHQVQVGLGQKAEGRGGREGALHSGHNPTCQGCFSLSSAKQGANPHLSPQAAPPQN